MEKNLFRFIWRYSRKQQVTTLLLTVVSFPFLYFSFDLPKTIINRAIPGENISSGLMDVQVFGYNFSDLTGIQLPQVSYLFLLCGILLALILLNGTLKMRINTYKGIMAERLLRRMRYILLERTLRFPLPQFEKTSSGEIVTMVTAEVEPLGGFFGDAFALVAFQGGTFLTIVLFMFMQSPWIGFAALALVPLQGYIIPRLQRRINQLQKDRIKKVRTLSNQIGEVVSGVEELRAQNHNTRTLAGLSQHLGGIFWVRLEIYRRKFYMKFVNNFLTQLTPLLFYSVGGYLTIYGHLSIGALVAALAAYKDMSAAWKELLGYYNRLADAKIKYEQLINQFIPEGILKKELFTESTPATILQGSLSARSLTWAGEDGIKVLDKLSFTIQTSSTNAFLVNNGTSREVLARILGRVLLATSGKLTIGKTDMITLPVSLTGTRIGLLMPDPVIFNTTIAANLYLGLQHLPPNDNADENTSSVIEALASGNCPYSPDADWINYKAVGVSDQAELTTKSLQILQAVELEDDIYRLGLNQLIEPDSNPELVRLVLVARSKMHQRLIQYGLDDVVQLYDFNQYNVHTSVATNLLFGKPVDQKFNYEHLGRHPIILNLLQKHQLKEVFFEIGLRSAELMLELFKGIPADHPIFDQYRFIDEEHLPQIQKAVQTANRKNGQANLSDDDYTLLLGITFHLCVQQHRLGLIDKTIQQQMVFLRHALHKEHPEVFASDGSVYPYSVKHYNPRLSILDNILFGRIAEGRPEAREQVHMIISEIVDELGIHKDITITALQLVAGIGGSRLSGAQKQKLSIARTLLKQPDILIANEPMSNLEPEQRNRIALKIREYLPDATQIWLSGTTPQAGLDFDQILTLESGQIKKVAPEISGEFLQQEPVHSLQDTDSSGALTEEVQTLQKLPLFNHLEPSLLKLLAFTSKRLTYLPGELLMKQGEDGDTAHIIISGQVEVFLKTESEEESLSVFSKNTLIGELALLCSTKRTASVRAMTQTTTLQITQEVFTEIAHQDTNFAYQLTRQLGRRLIHTTEELNKINNKHSAG